MLDLQLMQCLALGTCQEDERYVPRKAAIRLHVPLADDIYAEDVAII